MGGRSSSSSDTTTTVTAQNQQTTGDGNLSTSVGAGGALSSNGNIVQGMQGGTVNMLDPGGVALAQAATAAAAETAQVGLALSGQTAQGLTENAARLSEAMLHSANSQARSATDTIQALAANARQATTEAGAIASGGGVSQIQKWIPIVAIAGVVLVLFLLMKK